MKLKFPFVILCLLLFAAGAAAQKRVYVNEYLNIGLGARGLGMAGAQAATTDDITAAYWNPAGLAGIQSDYQVGLMHAEYFAGNSKYDYAGIVMPLKGKHRAIGISALRFATDDIAYTIDYVQPDGSFDDSKLRSISAGDYAFLISYAQEVKILKDTDFHAQLGVNAKVIYRNIGSMANAWGGGVDAGLQMAYRQWRFGVMLKDITTTYTAWSFHLTDNEKKVFGETGNDIPVKSYEVMYPRINIGIAKYFIPQGKRFQVMAEADGDITTDGRRNTLVSNADVSLDPHAGIEVSYRNTIFLRLGLGNIQRVLDDRDTTNNSRYTIYQPSVGLGLKLGVLSIDYAYTSLQTQNNPLYSHIISLRLDIARAHSGRHRAASGSIAPDQGDKPFISPDPQH